MEDHTRIMPPTSAQQSTKTVEQVLSSAFHELFDLPQVDLDDDFFLLGGHSLLVIRLIRIIERELSVEIHHDVIFEERTVRRIALRITRETGACQEENSEIE